MTFTKEIIGRIFPLPFFLYVQLFLDADCYDEPTTPMVACRSEVLSMDGIGSVGSDGGDRVPIQSEGNLLHLDLTKSAAVAPKSAPPTAAGAATNAKSGFNFSGPVQFTMGDRLGSKILSFLD